MTLMSDERDIYTPTRLNREARQQLESTFRGLWIEGEISNLATPASGHVYFTLKDSGAQVRCALFRQNRMRSPVQLREGMQVLLRGRVSIYEQRGDYQILAEYVEDSGEGRLRRQFDALKALLSGEGLFDPANKRQLPVFPRHIGIITSPSGAAIRDVMSVLERRFPCVRVTLIPSVVQGEEAPGSLRSALRTAEIAVKPDVLLLTRGGGSIEDLWAFNDEGLARDIAASPLITVSAVGHEVDFTIADFTADVRAPTPSAAAEMLVPDRQELAQTLDPIAFGLSRSVSQRLAMHQATVGHLLKQLGTQRPAHRLQQSRQRLQQLEQRLRAARQLESNARVQQLALWKARLASLTPRHAMSQLQLRLTTSGGKLQPGIKRLLNRRIEQLMATTRSLQGISPLAVLQRGYSVTTLKNGAVLTAASQVKPGDNLVTQLGHGALESTVNQIVTSNTSPFEKGD
jgi:exodeoxyribonuclease VII large subunit